MSQLNNKNSARNRRVKPRIKTQVEARIVVQLFGGSKKYEFQTRDISETGLLLSLTGNQKMVFNTSSLLEVWLYPDGHNAIYFLAKFVRFAEDNKSIGVRISDIDEKNRTSYYTFLEVCFKRQVEAQTKANLEAANQEQNAQHETQPAQGQNTSETAAPTQKTTLSS
jgi:c-di-GMP-binding flagellar brake protein YcgR